MMNRKNINIKCICCIVLLWGVLFNSCNRSAEKNIRYTIVADTLQNMPVYDACGFWEYQNEILYYIKPVESDSLYLYRIHENCSADIYGYMKLPDSFVHNGSREVSRWIIVNMDTVIAYEEGNKITFLDVKNNEEAGEFYLSSEDSNCVYESRCFANYDWNKQREALPLMYFHWNFEQRKYNGDVEILAEYSLKNGIKVLPLKYPYEIYDVCLVESLSSDPMVVCKGDTFVIGFQQSPMILCYNAITNHVDSMYIKNKYYKPLEEDTSYIKELSLPNYYLRQYILNFLYQGMVYSPYEDVYYRFFVKDLSLKNEEGLFNTTADKVYGVTLIDGHFNIIGDVCFNQGEYYRQYYPTRMGLLNSRKTANNAIIISKLMFSYE